MAKREGIIRPPIEHGGYIFTHPHIDHVGGIHFVRPDFPVYIG